MQRCQFRVVFIFHFQGKNMMKLVLVKSVGQLMGASTSAPMASCVVPGVLMVKTGTAQLLGIASLTQNIQRGKSVITTSRWTRESFFWSIVDLHQSQIRFYLVKTSLTQNCLFKVGLCASGLSCCLGRCTSGSCQPPTPSTKENGLFLATHWSSS